MRFARWRKFSPFSSLQMTTLNNILDFTDGDRFYRFGNADGKYWIVPAHYMRTALNLYQPSGTKGKLVKALLPRLHWLPPVRKVIHARTLNCRLCSELRSLLCKVFGIADIEFAVFEGTPSVHQKITMQLSHGNCILGYCKLSDSDGIKALFEREASILECLAGKGVTDIPKALYCGTLECGTHIFVQSTVKTGASKVVHEWGLLQERFLSLMQEKTKVVLPFEKSEYYRTLTALQEHLEWLPADIDRMAVASATARVLSRFRDRKVEFCAYHGDFTPWNMFVEKGELFVFDFEYAALSYPAGLDRYHFFTQTAVFEKHWNADDILAYANSDEGKWIDRKLYAMYLLDVISHFTMREGGKVTGDAATPFMLWGKLLEFVTSTQK